MSHGVSSTLIHLAPSTYIRSCNKLVSEGGDRRTEEGRPRRAARAITAGSVLVTGEGYEAGNERSILLVYARGDLLLGVEEHVGVLGPDATSGVPEDVAV